MNNIRTPSRVVLVALALGLVGILTTSVTYRMRGNPLIKQTKSPVALNKDDERMPTMGKEDAEGAMPAAMRHMMDGEDQTVMVGLMQRLQSNANDVTALLELANLFMPGSPESARGFINRAMVAAPSDARPPYYLGVLLAGQKQYGEAAEAMERSLSLKDSPATRYSLAVVYRYHLKEQAKGREQLERALQSSDLTPELRTLVEAELAK